MPESEPKNVEFEISYMLESKGPSWWARFPGPGYAYLAVSEISPDDARAKARKMLSWYGWRPEMGPEVGMLLIAAYERGRAYDILDKDERAAPIQALTQDE